MNKDKTQDTAAKTQPKIIRCFDILAYFLSIFKLSLLELIAIATNEEINELRAITLNIYIIACIVIFCNFIIGLI